MNFLDGKHTVFGRLTEGFDILEKLNLTICDDAHKPYQDVRYVSTLRKIFLREEIFAEDIFRRRIK